MITNITWAQFTLTLSLTTAAYYICIIAFFHKERFITFLKNAGSKAAFNQLAPDIPDVSPAGTLQLPALLQPFIDDIRETLRQASLKSFSIEELIFFLQIGMHKYEANSLFENKDAINQLIKDNAQNICSIHLDDERLNQLWIR